MNEVRLNLPNCAVVIKAIFAHLADKARPVHALRLVPPAPG